MATRGSIVALAGVDGAGKTTLAEHVRSAYSGRLPVIRVSPGKPQGQWLERVRLRLRREKAGTRVAPPQPETGRPVSFARAASAVLLAVMRVALTRRARRHAQGGALVVADRWPTRDNGRMDGPRLGFMTGARSPVGWLARLEGRLYAAIEPADLCIWLDVPLDAVLTRNQEREKAGKETDADIARRHSENLGFRPIAHRTVVMDNTGNLEDARRRVLELVEETVSATTAVT